MSEDSTLSYSVISNDNTALLAATMSGTDLAFDYQMDQHGTANVVIRATDSLGAAVDHTVAVTVNSVNDVPVVFDKAYLLDEPGRLSGNLLVDAYDTDGDAFTVNIVTGTHQWHHQPPARWSIRIHTQRRLS